MPTNLWRPGDSFSLHGSQVLPASIRKLHEARLGGGAAVTLWGTGSPRRELLHADDAASALQFCSSTTTIRNPSTLGLTRTYPSGSWPRRGRRHRLPGREHLGQRQARRNSAQAARRVPADGVGMEAAGVPRGRRPSDIQLVPRPHLRRRPTVGDLPQWSMRTSRPASSSSSFLMSASTIALTKSSP